MFYWFIIYFLNHSTHTPFFFSFLDLKTYTPFSWWYNTWNQRLRSFHVQSKNEIMFLEHGIKVCKGTGLARPIFFHKTQDGAGPYYFSAELGRNRIPSQDGWTSFLSQARAGLEFYLFIFVKNKGDSFNEIFRNFS